MSTKAVLACKTEAGNYIAKYVHYGKDDYDDAKELDFEEAMESVSRGDSCRLLDGFYMDYCYAVEELNWPEAEYVDGLRKEAPKAFASLDELKKYASSVYAELIYVVSKDDVIVYELHQPTNEFVDEKELEAMYGDEDEDEDE